MRRELPLYWRSVEERRGRSPTPEFPEEADRPPSGYSRRDFVKLMGASAALAGLQACERPIGRVVPYVHRPPEVVPGVPMDYATTMTVDGYGFGLLAQSREGRPVKVEGNPDHPASLGAAGVFEQASILQLYDPHRGRTIRQGTHPRGWSRLRAAAAPGGPLVPDGDGRGLRFLLEPTTSPFRIHWIEEIRRRYPGARFYFHAPAASDADMAGAFGVLGRRAIPLYDFRRADVVISLDADFLDHGPFRVRHAGDFAAARRIDHPDGRMNRLYAAGPLVTATAAMADHHLPTRSSHIGALARGLAAAVEDPSASLPELDQESRDWARHAARDLRQHGGRILVLAGPAQPPEVHALTYRISQRLGATGRTLRFAPSPIFEAGGPSHDLAGLAAEMAAGRVGSLVVLDANPVYTAPADVAFADGLRRVRHTLCAASHENETARLCEWYVPSAHYLEAWGDARALDGTLSTVQPLIRPLHDARSVDQLLMAFAGADEPSPHDALRERWRADVYPRHGNGADFETFWRESLRRGVVEDSAAPVEGAVEPPPPEVSGSSVETARPRAEDGETLEVSIRPDPRVYDGRWANNAWLLELPDPVTKLTWENAALIAPATAERLGIESGDVVRLEHGARALEIPVLRAPGHAPDAVTLHLGYGREGGEETALGRGVSAYRLRTSASPWLLEGASLRRVLDAGGEPVKRRLATTQTHWSMEGREIVLEHTLEEYRREPGFTRHHRGPVESLYEGPPLEGEQQWAMTLDLALCTGCSACVVACQAENNIPVVGKEGVLHSREMHWIRVDRYMTGSPEHPDIVHQPMLCQHCEKAPCEYVCPVNATVHSEDGLNEMIYNRCVGTRFCSNNCAWKVRRFNWFDYNNDREAPETLVLNPDVTVRERGVMEKCTYCVQRIRRAEREAERQGRRLERDEVRTACQQSCPTHAITFGSLTDPGSAVSRSREQPRIYSVLHELGTRPRTQYLARITNPNPELDEARRRERREERPL